MKRILKELAFLTRGERTGLFFAVGLLFVVVIVKVAVYNRPAGLPEDKNEILALLEDWKQKEDQVNEKISAKGNPGFHAEPEKEIRIIPFNPNTVSRDSLELMGLPVNVARNIIRYREAGGEFSNPADLARIYGMDSTLLSSLEPYMYFPSPKKEDIKLERESRMPLQVELNSAGSDELMALPGIGEVFAGRILKYRDLLGGFVSPDQLLEVYGMDRERYLVLESLVWIDSSLVKKIDLNRNSYSEMLAHPYLSEADVKAIQTYRRFVGRIERREELLENNLLVDSAFNKLEFYLSAGGQN